MYMRFKFSTKFLLKIIISYIAWLSTAWQEDTLSMYIKITLHKAYS